MSRIKSKNSQYKCKKLEKSQVAQGANHLIPIRNYRYWDYLTKVSKEELEEWQDEPAVPLGALIGVVPSTHTAAPFSDFHGHHTHVVQNT